MFRRFYQWALREHLIAGRPEPAAARPPSSRRASPKTLTEAQVEALLETPDTDTPLGLRDRTMLELMYASGLRVTELTNMKTVDIGLNEGVAARRAARATRSGWCRSASEAGDWLRPLPGRGAPRACLAGRRATRCSSPAAAKA